MSPDLDGTYTAAVDRIVEGRAVLLVDDDGETVAERHCSRDELPDGAGEGAICEVTFAADDLVDLVFLSEETAARRERMRARFEGLSRRLGEDADDADSA